ncbi:AbrB/MazE/SpoVT family DNA-binding domain-containing protein [Paenibacillus terrae]|uniref:AbrB/MazE/SpoVT family DNA-binding domain-containing protein n=1 Tax=Paenibacillus terrae TaxID=159743 RepID=UPI003B8A62B7
MKRDLDSLGRVVIPVEIRNRLGINKNTEMEFFITESAIVMRRSESESCLLCGGNKQLIRFKNLMYVSTVQMASKGTQSQKISYPLHQKILKIYLMHKWLSSC